MTALTRHPSGPLAVLWITATLGLAWNLFGLVRFAATEFATEPGLVAGGMTPAQAALYAGLPTWMALAFAVGVLGGIGGCVLLLLLRRHAALPVLAASLGGYVIPATRETGPP